MSAGFSLLRFEAAPVSAGAALVELDGEFSERAPARVRLLIERGGRGVEVPAITSGGESPWTATFAIALADLTDDQTEFALAPGRGPLIALPSPSVAGGPDEDRFLRLAREANELRHRLDEAATAADEVHAVRADLAEERHRAAELNRKLEAAESAATSARAERDDAIQARETADEEQTALRKQLRETEAQLTETERERASLRARAESADRAVADLTGRIEGLEQRAREAEERVVAAEDETRLARRDLRDTRARLESLLREQRHQDPARRGHEVPEPDPEPDHEPEPAATEPTDVIETREIAATDEREPAEPGDDDAPRTTATATRATRVVRIWDEPDDDERPDADRDARHTPEPVDPARVGAGHIEPAQTKPSALTPARIMVAIALLLLVAALVAIVLGAGLVG